MGTRRFATSAAFAVGLAAMGIQPQSSLPLVQATDLVYEGAFRLPRGVYGDSQFAYGGYPIAFNAANNSLYIVGHVQDQLLAEVSIPEIRKTTNLAELDTATVLQPFADILEARRQLINPADPNWKRIGGLLPYHDKLYVSSFAYYDAAKTQVLSHWVSGATIATAGDLSGPFQVGTVGAGFISGYFAEVPANLQATLGGPVVNGQCCLAIITRTSYGPALFAVNPDDIGVKNPAPAIPLVYYPSNHYVTDYDVQSDFFNATTHVRGVVIPSGTRSVLFFGRQGLGPYCYGTGEYCGDPVDRYYGSHAYPYASQVWAYDAMTLAEVKAGTKHPWDVRPYAMWHMELPFQGRGDGDINGATFDPKKRRLYITQAFGDEPLPLVLVYTVANSASGLQTAVLRGWEIVRAVSGGCARAN